jgi:hypothetical protein
MPLGVVTGKDNGDNGIHRGESKKLGKISVSLHLT